MMQRNVPRLDLAFNFGKVASGHLLWGEQPQIQIVECVTAFRRSRYEISVTPFVLGDIRHGADHSTVVSCTACLFLLRPQRAASAAEKRVPSQFTSAIGKVGPFPQEDKLGAQATCDIS
jgi:hypothetical protein